MKILMEMKHISIAYGERVILEHPEVWRMYAGECIGIVGINGAGKTSLLRTLAGEMLPEQGTVEWHGSRSYMTQWDDRSVSSPAGSDHLSGGEWTKAKLASIIDEKADIWLLDESTSHLDVGAIEQLEEQIIRHKGLTIIISHDRMTLNRVCTKIWEIENQKLISYRASRPGAYEAYCSEKARQHTEQVRAYEQVEEERRRLQQMLVDKREHAKEVGKAPKATRMTSKEIRSAEPFFSRKQGKVDKVAKSIESRIAKLPALARPYERPELHFDLNNHEPIFSKIIIEADALSLQVEDGPRLMPDFTMRIRPGMRLAITGDNGAGKTTLIRLLKQGYEMVRAAGSTRCQAAEAAQTGIAASGVLQYAPKARIGYFDQNLLSLDGAKSALRNVTATSRYPEHIIRTAFARLDLEGDRALLPVSQLSGGERVKVQLVKQFMSECNLLILDEPTNYLDMEACAQLEQLLKHYPGTLIFVSHDRAFCSAVATHRLHINGEAPKLTVWEHDAAAGCKQGKNSSTGKRTPGDEGSKENEGLTEEERLRFQLDWSQLLSEMSLSKKEEEQQALEEKFKALLAYKQAHRL